MTWTYSTSLSTDRDKIRFNIGDVNTDDQRVSDEEITATLITYPNVIKASIVILENLIMVFAGSGNERVGDVSVDYRSLTQTFKERISLLKERMLYEGASISAGGQSQSEKDSMQENEDRVAPNFQKT